MRAVLCHQWGLPDTLKLENLPSPEPGPGEVRVRVRAAAVNFPDLLMTRGGYQFKPDLPFVPGLEFAGDECDLTETDHPASMADPERSVISRPASAEVGPTTVLAATLTGLAELAVLGERPLTAPARVLGSGESRVGALGGAAPSGPEVGQGLVAEGGDGGLDAGVEAAGVLAVLRVQR